MMFVRLLGHAILALSVHWSSEAAWGRSAPAPATVSRPTGARGATTRVLPARLRGGSVLL